MNRGLDIDEVLRDWSYDPDTISARLVEAAGGRRVVQMRVEMGLLQMEIDHRPDGRRPGGEETYLDCLIGESFHAAGKFQMTEEQCLEADHEFVQFYHRRICWMALREFGRAVRDADHTLRLMDFVAEHAGDRRWLISHERYRPFVLFHRTQAAALAHLEQQGPEAAIEEILGGLKRIRRLGGKEHDEDLDQGEMAAQLSQLLDWVRDHYQVGKTLAEQLDDAIAGERYELAAKLRDRIARRQRR